MGKRLDELNAQFSKEIQEKNSKRFRKYKMYGVFACCLVAAIAVGMMINPYFFGFDVIQGKSMDATFEEESILFARRDDVQPQKGDLVIFNQDNALKGYLIKRVVATSGDTVDIDDSGNVYVNGQRYETDKSYYRKNGDIPVLIPEGKLFVLGDNGDESADSRHKFIGLVDVSAVKGIGV